MELHNALEITSNFANLIFTLESFKEALLGREYSNYWYYDDKWLCITVVLLKNGLSLKFNTIATEPQLRLYQTLLRLTHSENK